MKKLYAIVTALVLVFGVTAPLHAQIIKERGASTTAVEKASDEAVFNRVGDWFATVGKSDTEKEAILAERKAKRAAEKAQKELEKQKKLLEKQTKNVQKQLNTQSEQIKKQWGK